MINNNKLNITVLCEGDEEEAYFNSLLNLNIFNSKYVFKLRNVGGAYNLPSFYEAEYAKEEVDAILILFDVDNPSHATFTYVTKHLMDDYGISLEDVLSFSIFTNPCTMQLYLWHFKDINLNTSNKKELSEELKKIYPTLLAQKSYNAHQYQLRYLMGYIDGNSYSNLKNILKNKSTNYLNNPSTNMLKFLDYFEKDNEEFIKEININIDRNI